VRDCFLVFRRRNRDTAALYYTTYFMSSLHFQQLRATISIHTYLPARNRITQNHTHTHAHTMSEQQRQEWESKLKGKKISPPGAVTTESSTDVSLPAPPGAHIYTYPFFLTYVTGLPPKPTPAETPDRRAGDYAYDGLCQRSLECAC